MQAARMRSVPTVGQSGQREALVPRVHQRSMAERCSAAYHRGGAIVPAFLDSPHAFSALPGAESCQLCWQSADAAVHDGEDDDYEDEWIDLGGEG